MYLWNKTTTFIFFQTPNDVCHDKNTLDRIGRVMVSVLASGVVDYGFEARLVQTKDYKIGICCFSAKHLALRRKSKDWLAWNQDNVSEWGNISIGRLLFQWTRTIKIQPKVC